MTNAKRLLRNTIMLTVTAFVMRTVLVSFNVYLTNKIGAEGIGLFQLISAVYAMAITFSVAGVRLASMRLVADSIALGHKNRRQIMSTALWYSTLCGAFIGGIMFLFSGTIAGGWIGNPAARPSVEILCISLPFVSMSAALNGYFTSESKILRYTFVQLIEQFFKIIITVFCLKNSNGDLKESCCAIVTGISLGEVISLAMSYTLYRYSSKDSTDKLKSGVLKGLLRIALPDAAGSEIRSTLSTLEHLLIPKGLKKSGVSVEKATATYGIIHGMSLPIVLYPSALLSSLSGLLVPQISALYISKNKTRINYMIHRVLHITLLFSIGVAGVLYFTADTLSVAFYNNDDAGFYMRVLAPLVPVMYTDMSVDGMLKGLDQQVKYMKYNVIDAASCVILVYFLVPIFSVKGYVIVIFISEIINFALSFHRLTVVSDVEIELFRDLLIPILCIVIACISVGFFGDIFSLNISIKALATVEISLCVCVYVIMLRIFNAISKEEIQWFKSLVKKK